MILHMCACVCFREQKVYPSSLRQLGMAIQTLPGLALLHSHWLGDTFFLWLFCTCGLAVTRAVKRLGSGLPWLWGLVKDANPTKPGTCKAAQSLLQELHQLTSPRWTDGSPELPRGPSLERLAQSQQGGDEMK